ncbi:MAG: amidohydrolase family protein, partial [Alphaproteobacteria bacterium]|nr:amidohydrolase family protein [Alphaproteobacteria bacterium]
MALTAELILRNGTVVNHDGVGQRDIAVSGGRIVGIGPFAAAQAGEVIDCTGLHVLPGVIDSQVHLREPGAEHKEDWASASRAAAHGGVTTMFDMPNNPQPTVT